MPRKMMEVGVEGDLFREHDETKSCKNCGCVAVGEAQAEHREMMLQSDVQVFFNGRVGTDHGRRYTVTDGVLYEDEFPSLFQFIVGAREEEPQNA